MTAKFCVRAGLVFGLAAYCAAAAAGELYLTPSYHQTGLEKSSNTLKLPGGDVHFDTTFGDDTGPGLAIGYAFGAPYRIEVDYQDHSNDLKNSTAPDDSVKATTFVANGWRDFGPWYHLRPYAGVGLGHGTLKLNDLDGDFYFWQLGAGVQWYFMHNVALDVGYRYQKATSDPELNGNGQKLTMEYASQSAQIGIRIDLWNF